MSGPSANTDSPEVCMTVNPGVCGFTCLIRARKIEKRLVSIGITDSECRQIQGLADKIKQLSLKELFVPMTKNPVYRAAEQSGCHPSCVIPSAVLKTAEVVMEMALARDVTFTFRCDEEIE